MLDALIQPAGVRGPALPCVARLLERSEGERARESTSRVLEWVGPDECGPCTCVGELRAIERSAAPRDVALNARFRAGKPISTPELSRRLALRRSGGGEVPHEQRELKVDGHAQVELVPRGPLEKDTEYEVVQWTKEHSLPQRFLVSSTICASSGGGDWSRRTGLTSTMSSPLAAFLNE